MRNDAVTRRHEAALRSIHPVFRWRVEAVLRELANREWQPVVWEGRRTTAEQAEKVRLGYSKTMGSWHVLSTHAIIPAGKDGIDIVHGAAADIVDRRWEWGGPCANLNHHFWLSLGTVAKAQGLEWGGDWKKFRDVAHVQMRFVEMAPMKSATV